MKEKPAEAIPADVLAAAAAAGLGTPDWYVGRRGGTLRTEPSTHEIVMDARRQAGITEELPLIDELPPLQPDPYAEQ